MGIKHRVIITSYNDCINKENMIFDQNWKKHKSIVVNDWEFIYSEQDIKCRYRMNDDKN